MAFRASLYSCYVLLCLSPMPIEDTSDTQYLDAGYSCLLSDCRIAAVPHLVVQYLGKMYATNPPLGFSSALYFSAFQLPDWHFGLHLFDDVGHQAQIVLHQYIPGLQISGGTALQALLSRAADRGLGNDPALPVRCRDKNRLLHSSNSAADSIRIAPFTTPYALWECPYTKRTRTAASSVLQFLLRKGPHPPRHCRRQWPSCRIFWRIASTASSSCSCR